MNRKGWMFSLILVVALVTITGELAEARRGGGRRGTCRTAPGGGGEPGERRVLTYWDLAREVLRAIR